MNSVASRFIDFVRCAPTAFHAVSAFSNKLKAAGFLPLSEHLPFTLVPGQGYYVTRNQSSIIAFRMPENDYTHFQIIASHSDSPTFKLKAGFESASCNHYLRLNTERYGGMIMSTWLDRPLSIAGRILVRENQGISSRLVNLDRDAVLIPNMPIHFNREVNSGYAFNPQVDLLPLYGNTEDAGALLRELASLCGVLPENIVSADLFLYSRVPGSIWGAENQFFSCARIDDLECAYTSLEAFLAGIPAPGMMPVWAVFDNEEVGSRSKQGAESSFLVDTLSRAASASGKDASAFRAMLSSSFMVSADNAHALHPNHPEKYDETNHVYMNKGIVIKQNASQKYTTDAVSDALFSEICRIADVPVQHFANRSDVPGGSTLGNIANVHASMNTVDIGLAQLAMHSSYETAGTLDLDLMIRGLTAFYESCIETQGDGQYCLLRRDNAIC